MSRYLGYIKRFYIPVFSACLILMLFLYLALPFVKISAQGSSASTDVLSDVGLSSLNFGPSDFKLRHIDAFNIEMTFNNKPDVKILFRASTGQYFGASSSGENTDSIIQYDAVGRSCFGYVKHNSDNNSYEVDVDFKPTASSTGTKGGCSDTSTNKLEGLDSSVASDQSNAGAFFYWLDSANIGRADNAPDWRFRVSPDNPNLFLRVSEEGKNCQDRILVEGDTVLLYELNDKESGSNGGVYKGDPPSQLNAGNCKFRTETALGRDLGVRNNVPIPLASTSITENKGKEADTGVTSGGGSVGDDNPTCETAGNPLGWILCAVFNGLVDLVDWFFRSFIDPYLNYSPIDPNPADDNLPYQIWSSFRFIGNVILVIGLIVAIFGQSIGGGMIDAYTAKKMLPRILVAAVLVNLSMYMVAIAADITNVLGRGIGTLITAPLTEAHAFNFTPGATDFAAGMLGALGAIAGGIWLYASSAKASGAASTAGAAFHWILIAIMLPVALITLGIFVTLVIRRTLLLLLAVISPIAFALYVLPATEKYFKKWWETLATTLLVYPIVVAIFAIADISFVLSRQANDGYLLGVMGDLVGFIILFIPLAVIPFAFKLAGGVLGGIYGALAARGEKGKERFLGDPRDEHSRRAKMARSQRDSRLLARGRFQDYLNSKEKALQPGGAGVAGARRFGTRRRSALNRLVQSASVSHNTEGFNAAKSAQTDQASKRIAAIIATGDDSIIRAFFSRQATQADADAGMVDGSGNTVIPGEYYSIYQDQNGGFARVPTSLARASQKAFGDSQADIQELFGYELSKDGNVEEIQAARGEFLNKMQAGGYGIGEANATWAGVKYRHKGAQLEQKHTSIKQDAAGNWYFSGTDHDKHAEELNNKLKVYDMAGLSSTTASAMVEGLSVADQYLSAKVGDSVFDPANHKPGSGLPRNYAPVTADNVDQYRTRGHDMMYNYQSVARNLRNKYGAGGASDEEIAASMAAQQPMQRGPMDPNEPSVAGSARAVDMWKRALETESVIRGRYAAGDTAANGGTSSEVRDASGNVVRRAGTFAARATSTAYRPGVDPSEVIAATPANNVATPGSGATGPVTHFVPTMHAEVGLPKAVDPNQQQGGRQPRSQPFMPPDIDGGNVGPVPTPGPAPSGGGAPGTVVVPNSPSGSSPQAPPPPPPRAPKMEYVPAPSPTRPAGQYKPKVSSDQMQKLTGQDLQKYIVKEGLNTIYGDKPDGSGPQVPNDTDVRNAIRRFDDSELAKIQDATRGRNNPTDSRIRDIASAEARERLEQGYQNGTWL